MALPLADLASILNEAAENHADTEELHKLDQKAWSHMSAVDEALQVLLRENAEQVLSPERGDG